MLVEWKWTEILGDRAGERSISIPFSGRCIGKIGGRVERDLLKLHYMLSFITCNYSGATCRPGLLEGQELAALEGLALMEAKAEAFYSSEKLSKSWWRE